MQLEAFGRERLKRGPIQFGKQRGARTGALAERPLVKLLQQFANRLVEFGQAEETAMAERGHHPAFRQKHPIFRLGLVESHRMQVVREAPKGASESFIPFTPFVALSMNW
jgi:hypothetical protein